MNKYTPLYCFLLSWLTALTVSAQSDPSMQFTRIGLNEGLSQSTVFDIAQDKTGNIWIATQNGLNKYNGYEFTVYQSVETDSTSIGSNYIRALKITDNDHIWIGTDKGLSCYDSRQDRFSNFVPDASDGYTPISHLAEIDSTHLLVLADKTLYVFDTGAQDFTAAGAYHMPEGMRIHSLSEQQDIIYIGTDEGLFLYHKRKKNISKLPCKEIEDKNDKYESNHCRHH